MNLGKLVHTKSGKYIMSILLGLGLATLFRTVCKDKRCLLQAAPPNIKEIQDQVYKHGTKCYKYSTISTTCDANRKSVPTKFEDH